MDDFIMKPKIDFAFKEIMVDDMARKGFVSATLKIDPKKIRKTILLNTNLRRIHKDDKQGILDVRIEMDDDTEIDTEIQLTAMLIWPDRVVFYLAKMISDQLQPGEEYSKMKRYISISILDFNLFKERKEYYSRFQLLETTEHFPLTEKVDFHIIELPKLPKDLKEDSDPLLLWSKFIAAEKKEEFDMLAKRDPYIKSAYQQLQVISQNKEKRMEYEAREKAVRDYNQLILESRQEGIKEGIREGVKEGQNGVIKVLLESMSVDQVAKATKLPVDQVQKIADSI